MHAKFFFGKGLFAYKTRCAVEKKKQKNNQLSKVKSNNKHNCAQISSKLGPYQNDQQRH